MSEPLNLVQAVRLLKIVSPLGPDVLVLRRLNVREAVGQPFTLTAEVVSTRLDLAAKDLVGKPVTCTVTDQLREPRHFHGIVRGFARIGPYGRGLCAYRIEAVPRLWQLSRTGDCRVFQDKSAKDICSAIFGEHEVAPVRWGASLPTAKRPYCVQFNEADLDFVQRVLEEVGAGYFFEHKEGDHTLVVCGGTADYPLVPGEPQVVRPDGDMIGALTAWTPLSALQPGKVRARDHDGLKPGSLLDKQASTILGTPGAAAFEMFGWPGGQAVRPDADPAKLAMEGFEAAADLVRATGRDPTVFAGGRLKVRPSIDGGAPETWLVTEAVHEAFDETHLAAGGTARYANALVLMPADRPWRPAHVRPRPPMVGLHSALVTGPKGEEIHCDEYGRVKVRFLWDRAGPTDDASSCWVRVVQAFAGAWGGSWTLPRVGDEVLVGFLHGDPDRPVVVGSLYNAEQKPIYTLPANKTQSGFRTRSSKQGGSANFNELRFEDKKGSEEIHLQAEKDLTILVKNNRTETVKVDRKETVEGKHTESVKLDRKITVEQGNDDFVVKTGNAKTEISMGNLDTLVKMGNYKTDVSMGNISTKAGLGKIEIEALQSITLTCGTSKIELTPAGVTIQALMIKVSADVMLETKAGAIAKHEAGALMIVKGALVMIN